MVAILIDPSYARSVWCARMLDGLVTELKLKRIPFTILGSFSEMAEQHRCFFLIGAESGWIHAALTVSNRLGVHPILLCNQEGRQFPYTYSTVGMDCHGSILNIMEKLHAVEKSRVALYGANPQSLSDQGRIDAYLFATEGKGQNDIFYNFGSLEGCYRSFSARSHDFDSVICANNFAAISLVRRLGQESPDELERLVIIGHSDVRMTGFFYDHVITVSTDFRKVGCAAVSLYECIRKKPELSHIIMAVKWDDRELARLTPRWDSLHAPLERPDTIATPDAFYEDGELQDMMRLEKLLYDLTQDDYKILNCLMNNRSYEDAAECCFLTTSAVKYRVRKMLCACRCDNKTELLGLLKKYLPENWAWADSYSYFQKGDF